MHKLREHIQISQTRIDKLTEINERLNKEYQEEERRKYELEKKHRMEAQNEAQIEKKKLMTAEDETKRATEEK